ncbi:S-type pyocin domain-containing protein [Pseudomonas lini]|uniref:S-type pyocin domain-containing protein n=1 Tax=Pseudomonas lini TaxID=163011 RepID=UPI00345E846F
MPQEKNILVNRGIPRKPSSSSGFGFGAGGVSNPDHSDRAYDLMDSATDWLIDNNAYTEELFNENIKNIIHITDAELAKTRAAVAAVVPGADALDIELRTLKLQLSKARTDHQKQIETANLYYGHDPLTHKGENPDYKGFDVPPGRRGGQRGYYRAVEKWNVSYAAAYEAKFLAEQIKLLDARLATQNNAIAEANAEAAAAAQARAQAEAKRVAEEQARKAAEAEARRVAEERARLARIAATVAAEQARKEAEALREAERRAWIAAEDAAETQRQAEVQKARKPALATRTFPVSGSAAAAGPVFTIAGGTLAPNRGTALAITATLRVAVSAITETIAATAIPAVAGVAALIYPSELGNGERYALSVPLSELAPANPDDLLAVAASGGEIDLPVVLGSMTTDDEMEFVVASTDGMLVPSNVPIRLATLDPHSNVYRSYSPDASSIGMTWTPIVKPGDASTALPASVPNIVLYNGGSPWGQTPWIDTHPELELYDFGGGFITVFPIESGIPPIYTVFNNPYEGATTEGEHSGRDFNPEQIGGPTLDLKWTPAVASQEGVNIVELHTSKFPPSDANKVMIDRLHRILRGELEMTDTDKRFYTHEIREFERFKALGYGDTEMPDAGSSVWNNVHTATLEDFKLKDDPSLLYTPEALAAAAEQDEREYKQFLKEMW